MSETPEVNIDRFLWRIREILHKSSGVKTPEDQKLLIVEAYESHIQGWDNPTLMWDHADEMLEFFKLRGEIYKEEFKEHNSPKQ